MSGIFRNAKRTRVKMFFVAKQLVLMKLKMISAKNGKSSEPRGKNLQVLVNPRQGGV